MSTIPNSRSQEFTLAEMEALQARVFDDHKAAARCDAEAEKLERKVKAIQSTIAGRSASVQL